MKIKEKIGKMLHKNITFLEQILFLTIIFFLSDYFQLF